MCNVGPNIIFESSYQNRNLLVNTRQDYMHVLLCLCYPIAFAFSISNVADKCNMASLITRLTLVFVSMSRPA